MLVALAVISCNEPSPTGGDVPAALSVSADSVGFTALGDTIEVSAVVLDPTGDPIDFDVAWASGDTLVVTVTEGILVAAGAGNSRVTATAGGLSEVVDVTVEQVAHVVELAADTLRFTAVAATDTVEVVVRDENGFEIEDPELLWLTSDTLVVTLDGPIATAVGEGAADLSVAADTVVATRPTVVRQMAATLSFSPSPIPSLLTGDTVRITVEPADANGFGIADRVAELTVADTTIARLDSGALLTGVAEGVTWIHATLDDAVDSVGVGVGTRLEVVTETLSDGVVGIAYHEALLAIGTDSAATWSVVSGALPPGIELSPSGSVHGVAGSTGTFAFEVEISSGGQIARQAFALHVRGPYALTLTYVDTLGVPRSGRILISDDGTEVTFRLDLEDPSIESARIIATFDDPRTAKTIDDGFRAFPASPGATWVDQTEDREELRRTTDRRYGGTEDGSVTQTELGDSLIVAATKPLASGDSLDMQVATGDTLHIWVGASLYADFFGQGMLVRYTHDCGVADIGGTANPVYIVGTGLLADLDCPVTVLSWLPTITTEPDRVWVTGPDGIHAPLQGRIRATNIVGTAVWGLTGDLPSGVSWTPSGNQIDIDGTPTESGTFVFTASVTDDRGLTDERSFTLMIPHADTVALHPDSVARGGMRATLVSGFRHSCGLDGSGAAHCWGRNEGQLGTGDHVERGSPVAVLGGLTFVELATGQRHTCGLTAGGGAYCWGTNDAGPLGTGTGSSTEPVPVSGGVTFDALAAGDFHTCGLSTTGLAWCWGSNTFGQLGDGSTTTALTPVPVSGGVTYARIATGGRHTCAVRETGGVQCWGQNDQGQLGDGTQTDRSAPVDVPGAEGSVFIAAGDEHTCALSPLGGATCWGSNGYGQHGDGSGVAASSTPVPVGGGRAFRSISAGSNHMCGIGSDDSVHCWGRNHLNQSGASNNDIVILPERVAGPQTYVRVAAGGDHTCGRSSTAETLCWGFNREGSLGDGSGGVRPYPDPVDATPGTFEAIAVGFAHSCGLSGGDAYCWGRNDSYQVGQRSSDVPTPTPVSAPVTFTAIHAGDSHVCALAAAGEVYCWGAGWVGQLGHGRSGLRSEVPVLVGGGQTFQLVTTGFSHTCGLDASGAAFCWGGNNSGQLGDGSRNERSSPVAVSGGHQFSDLSAGASHTCGVTTTGDMYCWGRNFDGEIGIGTMGADETTPQLVSGGHSWRSVGLGNSFGCGIRTDDVVLCWGNGGAGRLGNGGTSASSVPVVVSGLTGVEELAVGWYSACATVNGGEARCWGANELGQLASGTTVDALAPVVSLGGATWDQIAIGWGHGCGVDLSGTASCWGYNESGQLGRSGHLYQTGVPVPTVPY